MPRELGLEERRARHRPPLLPSPQMPRWEGALAARLAARHRLQWVPVERPMVGQQVVAGVVAAEQSQRRLGATRETRAVVAAAARAAANAQSRCR